MKKRTGFVSNSSSSSFIVACKPKKTTVKFTVEVDLSEYGTVLKNKKELLKYMLADCGFKSEEEILTDEYQSEDYKKMLKELENGNHIIHGSFSNEGYGPLDMLLCYRGIKDLSNENVKVIFSEAGF
jgi:hypothetical protein